MPTAPAPATLRAFWSARQGLDGSLDGKSAAEVLERSGWSRSVGGVGPYLTLFSRGGLTREAIDRELDRIEIHELPSGRGCAYVVARSDFALALQVGQPFAGGEMKVALKLGVTESEIDKLCVAVLKALEKGPLDPDGLREAVGGAARSLGAEGTKKGLSSTLPLALGRLQPQGHIRRLPKDGRLDQQRFRYAIWKNNPLSKTKRTVDEAMSELARRYFRWIAPATAAEFQWFAGLGVKATQAALAPLGLVPLVTGDERLIFPDDRDELLSFRVPKEPRYALVSSLDALAAHRRDIRALLDDEEAKSKLLTGHPRSGSSVFSDLTSHGIVDRGHLIGLWEFDVESESIAWALFAKSKPDKALLAAIDRTERFVRDELGDARAFSLDSPKSRAPRIAVIRESAKATR